jgi:hypothetical protein
MAQRGRRPQHHKRTSHHVRAMSALPPKADVGTVGMSAMCQSRHRTARSPLRPSSVDHRGSPANACRNVVSRSRPSFHPQLLCFLHPTEWAVGASDCSECREAAGVTLSHLGTPLQSLSEWRISHPLTPRPAMVRHSVGAGFEAPALAVWRSAVFDCVACQGNAQRTNCRIGLWLRN